MSRISKGKMIIQIYFDSHLSPDAGLGERKKLELEGGGGKGGGMSPKKTYSHRLQIMPT